MNKFCRLASLIGVRLILVSMISCACIIATGCPLPMIKPGEHINEPVFEPINESALFERMLFPEKRRTRVIGFQGTKASDLDGDGIANDKDAFPLDSSYPGPYIDVAKEYNGFPLLSERLYNKSIYTIPTAPANSKTSNLKISGTISQGSSVNWQLQKAFFPPNDISFSDSDEMTLHALSLANGSTFKNYSDESFGYYLSNIDEKLLDSGVRLASAMDRATNLNQMLSSMGEILFGDPDHEVLELFEYKNSEPYLHLDDMDLTFFGDRFGMGSYFDDFWDLFSRDTVIFSTMRDPGVVYNSGSYQWTYFDEINLASIDNQIYYSCFGKDYSDSFDSRFTVKLSENLGPYSEIDYANMVVVKMLVSRDNKDMSNDLRMFISNNELSQKYISGHQLSCTLEDSGVTYESWNDTLYYDLYNDKSTFGKIMYGKYRDIKENAQDDDSRINFETYSLFLFFVPVRYNYSSGTSYSGYPKWIVVGGTAHFWPIQDRVTVAMTLNASNASTDAPLVLPYEYLMDPGEFMKNYSSDSKSGALFTSAASVPQTVRNNFMYGMPQFKINLSGTSNTEDSGAGSKILITQATSSPVTLPSLRSTDTNQPRIVADTPSMEKLGVCTVTPTEVTGGNTLMQSLKSGLPNNKSCVVTFPDILEGTYGGYENAKLILPQTDVIPYSGDVYNYQIPISIKGLPITRFASDIVFAAEQWIPNDGSKLGGLGFDLSIETAKGQFRGEADVRLLSPEDPGFDDGDNASTSNVYRNRGAGIELYARFPGEDTLLVRFRRRDAPTSGTDSYVLEGTRYISVDQDENEGIANMTSGYRLYRDANGHVTFNDGFRTTSEFALKPITDGVGRPGDDFLMRFGLRRYESSRFSSTVQASDFVAISDASILNEARSYLDSGITWTRRNDGQSMEAVAYSLGAKDTKARFVTEMNAQRNCIAWYYSANNPSWTQANPNPHPEWSGWAATTAPDGAWENYLSWNSVNNGNGINGNYAFKPNFNDDTGAPNYSTHAAGTDCNGFVQRSANGRYALPAITQSGIGWPQGEVSCPGILNTYCVVFPTGNNNAAYTKVVPGDILVWDNPDAGGSDHIVIVNRVEPAVRNALVVDNANVFSRVFVIEATDLLARRCVTDTQTWQALRGNAAVARNYQLGRLIP